MNETPILTPPAAPGHPDGARWTVRAEVARFAGVDVDAYRAEYGKEEGERRFFAEHAPTDVQVEEKNLLMYGGVSNIWQCLVGNGTGTAGQALTFFNNANATLGVGDSTAAEAATQTDLQAATNKLRKAMDAGFPQHTDGTTSGSATITFKSTFGTGEGNFSWQEWSIFNSSSGGRMLNRRVVNLGVKTSAASWAFTITITLS